MVGPLLSHAPCCHSDGIRPLYKGKTVLMRRRSDGFRQNDNWEHRKIPEQNLFDVQYSSEETEAYRQMYSVNAGIPVLIAQ